MKQNNFRKILTILVIVFALTTGYFFNIFLNKKTSQGAQDEAKSVSILVGKLVILPEGEIPTVATVSDPEALKNQAFFNDAKKGDKVLIYANAKKAILYDPVLNKVVNMAPFNLGENQKPSL